jgi:hypothetical protein
MSCESEILWLGLYRGVLVMGNWGLGRAALQESDVNGRCQWAVFGRLGTLLTALSIAIEHVKLYHRSSKRLKVAVKRYRYS